jgi:hypothetical protein
LQIEKMPGLTIRISERLIGSSVKINFGLVIYCKYIYNILKYQVVEITNRQERGYAAVKSFN